MSLLNDVPVLTNNDQFNDALAKGVSFICRFDEKALNAERELLELVLKDKRVRTNFGPGEAGWASMRERDLNASDKGMDCIEDSAEMKGFYSLRGVYDHTRYGISATTYREALLHRHPQLKLMAYSDPWLEAFLCGDRVSNRDYEKALEFVVPLGYAPTFTGLMRHSQVQYLGICGWRAKGLFMVHVDDVSPIIDIYSITQHRYRIQIIHDHREPVRRALYEEI